MGRVCRFSWEMLQREGCKWLYFPCLLIHLWIVKNCYICFLISSLSHTALKAQGEVCVWEWEKMFLRWLQMNSFIWIKKGISHLISSVYIEISPSFSCYILQQCKSQSIIPSSVILLDKGEGAWHVLGSLHRLMRQSHPCKVKSSSSLCKSFEQPPPRRAWKKGGLGTTHCTHLKVSA